MMNKSFFNLFAILIISIVPVSISGCAPDAEIATYQIPKEHSGLKDLRERTVSPQTPAKASKTRMIVAMFEETDATWFFKITGDPEQIESAKSQWETLFNSVSFKDGNPEFQIPDGWTEAPEKPMRYKTLVMGDSKLELAISNLSPGQDLLLNANRWRKQIGLADASEDEIETVLPVVETDSGKYRLFDQTGVGSGQMRPPFAGGAMTPPFAGGAAPFAGGAPMSGSSPTNSGVTFDVPEGWESGRTSSMVQARLKKKTESGEAQITIIEMPADANEWEPNVVRWAGQVQMNELTQEELADRTTKINVDGTQGQLVKLINLDENASSDGIIAGMVKHEGSAWFLKLSGEKSLVVESEKVFSDFIDSIRFK